MAIIWLIQSRVIVPFVIFGLLLIGPKLTQRLSRILTGTIDQLPPFRGRYEEIERLHFHIQKIVSTNKIPDWANTIVSVTRNLFKSERVLLLIRDEANKILLVKASFGVDAAEASFSSLPLFGALATYLGKTRMAFIGDFQIHVFPDKQKAEVSDDLEFLKGSAFIPIILNDLLYGVLVLGPKSNGRIYNSLDLTSLEALARAAEHTLQVILSGLNQEQMTSVWAHDLVKPFTVKGSLSKLEEMLAGKFGDLSGSLRGAIQLMIGDVYFVRKHLNRIIHPGQPDNYEIKPSPIAPVFERLKEKYWLHATSQGINWRATIPPASICAFWDSDMIEHRVLENLIENAFRHTPKDGIVELNYRINDDGLCLFVKDTGVGIREDDIKNLFQPRFQIEDGNGGLAGLGLFSAKTVIEAHKGKIWVESNHGKGTTFFFDIPLIDVATN